MTIKRILELIEQTTASNLDKEEIKELLETLEDDSILLACLEANGVDNWSFYGEAYNDYLEQKGESDEG